MARRRIPLLARHTGTGLLLLVLGAACGHLPPPDVLLITVDTLRADALGCYGREDARTPAIDRLAAEGVRFENAFTPRGATVPALTTILTGVPPLTHGVLSNGFAFAGGLTSLADLLGARGYRTGAFLTNHCATLVSLGDQVTRGFDRRHCAQLRGRPQHEWDRDATAAAITWMQEDSSLPTLTWVHLVDPHAPHDPPPEFRKRPVPPALAPDRQEETIRAFEAQGVDPGPEVLRELRGLYDAEVAGVDARVGRLVEAARAASSRPVVIVLAADHGEELFDHDNLSGHNYSVYDSVLRIPLILVAPGRVPLATTCGAFAQLEDVLPTLADLLDLDVPPAVEGRSLLPRLGESRARSDDAAIGTWNQGILTLRTPRWRFVWNQAPWRERANETAGVDPLGDRAQRLAPFRHEMLLFDHESDPGEEEDLLGSPRPRPGVPSRRPAPLDALRDRLTQWRAWHEALGVDYREIEDERVSDELRRLGYL